MSGTTHLIRLRTRMLATAYTNANSWARRWAFITDQAVSTLARRDPAAAEALAAQLLAPEFLHDTQILGAAVEAGIDTSHWEERREKARAYAREAHELPPWFDPDTEASRLWASLFQHYRPIAAALAGYLRELPPTWQEDLFTPSPDSPAGHQSAPEMPGPETAPYDVSWEDCPACLEAQDQCRYHAGVFAGMEYQRDLITTALTDHTAIDQLQQRHAEREASAAQTAAADTSTPRHRMTPGAAIDSPSSRPGVPTHRIETDLHMPKPVIKLTSFGYLHLPRDTEGRPVPPQADRIEDVRDRLRDPAAARDILDLDGLDPRVQDVVRNTPGALELIGNLADYADLPAGPRHIAIGCAGGL